MTLPTALVPGRARRDLASRSIELRTHDLVPRLLTVERVVPLAPRMRRVVFRVDPVDGFPLVTMAVGDHVKLVFPEQETGELILPEIGPAGLVRREDRPRPLFRDYTVRALDRAAATLSVDFVVHDHGVAGRWAAAARPGDRLGAVGPRGSHVYPTGFAHYLIAGDETALPAIARWLEELPAEATATVLVEVRSAEDEVALPARQGTEIGFVHRATEGAGALERAVRSLALPEDLFVWVAGEATALTSLRRHLRQERGIPKEHTDIDGYWKAGVGELDAAGQKAMTDRAPVAFELGSIETASRASPRVLARSLPARVAWLLVALALLVVVVAVGIAVGSKDIPLARVVAAFGTGDGSVDRTIVLGLRLPRTLLGILVGAALGVSGALMQGLTRNPLADPGLLGVNAGAAFAVVVAIGFLGVGATEDYLWFALSGALLAAVVVFLIGSAARGGPDPVSLTLAGVAVGAVLSAVSTGLTLLDPTAFDLMRNWTAGSLEGRGADVVLAAAPFFAVGAVLAALATRGLNAVALGDDVAASLGVHPVRMRVLVAAAVAPLAGAATAVAGPIGFVGLMVPHAVRILTGADQRWMVAFSAVGGSLLVLAADILGRLAVRPAELPVGIVTAIVGAPVLIALACRMKPTRS